MPKAALVICCHLVSVVRFASLLLFSIDIMISYTSLPCADHELWMKAWPQV